MDYEVLSHTAETGIKAYGRDLNQAFSNAAKATFWLLTDPNLITPTREIEISLQSSNVRELLVDWLNELLFYFETEGLVFSQFDVRISGASLKASAKGEEFKADKHPIKTQIKATTYHNLEVWSNGQASVQVYFDV